MAPCPLWPCETDGVLVLIPSYEMIRNRIRDHFTQNWFATISDSSKLEYY